jgi:hypothetical protein
MMSNRPGPDDQGRSGRPVPAALKMRNRQQHYPANGEKGQAEHPKPQGARSGMIATQNRIRCESQHRRERHRAGETCNDVDHRRPQPLMPRAMYLDQDEDEA